MEDTREQTGYWCHMCNQMVDPIMEVETIKCPLCLGGFVEEMDNPPAAIASLNHYPTNFQGGGFNSDRSLSLWAPVLLGMMSNPRRRNRLRSLGSAEEEDDDQVEEDQSDNIHHHHHHHHHHHLDHGEEEIELNRELESIVRRRRSSATILQLLQGIRAGMQFAAEGNAQSDVSNRDRSNNRDRDRVILINPFNQTIIVQSSYGVNNNTFANQNQNSIGSLGDYFVGPGLDLLLQHLAENDPNRYGTPPAQKDAVEAMPTVRVEENLQCSVCLEDFDIGAEAKEMPCKHKFHASCILPWLEMHSSCPICRHQLPVDESKLDSGVSRSNSNGNSTGETSNGNNTNRRMGEGNSNEDGRRLSVALPWRLSSLFSFSDSAAANANSSSALSSADSSTNPFGSSTRTDENGV